MARSPLANLSPEEFASRRRMLMSVLAVIGVLVVVLVVAQVRAVVLTLPDALDAAVPRNAAVEQDIRALEQQIGNIGAQAVTVGEAGEDLLLNAVFQEALIQEIAEGINAEPEPVAEETPPAEVVDTPVEPIEESGATEEAEVPAGGGDWEFTEDQPEEETTE